MVALLPRRSALPLYHDRDQTVLLCLLRSKVANSVAGPSSSGSGDSCANSKRL
jgi:hypothetical protein